MLSSFTLDQLPQIAASLLTKIGAHKIVVFNGHMGAGKTTLITALCNVLGVLDAATSPTYTIINQYKTKQNQTVYHMDWYRLKSEEEAIEAGVEEVLYSGNICLIEWPQNAAGLLPANTLYITIEAIDDQHRKIVI
jgi:tRNA threonylcarbamoyladenosine biosynthesis protein TsaE